MSCGDVKGVFFFLKEGSFKHSDKSRLGYFSILGGEEEEGKAPLSPRQ